MNKQDLKFHAQKSIYQLEISVLRTIDVFPPGDIWDERHVGLAVDKLVENPELSTDEVIEKIKIADPTITGRSWVH